MKTLLRNKRERASAHARRFPRPYWILLSGEAIQSVGYGMIVPFVALYLTDTIGLSTAAAGGLLALWSVIGVAGQPLGGVLADRIGRRPVIIGGIAASAVGSIAFGLVSSLWAVALLIVIWGIGNAVFEPAAGALVADVAPEELRTEAFGLWRVVNNAGFTVGPPLTALVVWLASLRLSFVVAGATLLAYFMLALRLLPETRPIARAGEPPARFREALRDRLLLLVIAGSAATALVYGIFESALPVFLHDERGMDIAAWGLIFGINPLLVVVFQYPLSRWAGGRSSRAVLAGGSLVLGVSLALLWPFASVAAVVVAVVVFTLGEMLTFPVATAVAADLAPERLRGSYQGALNLAYEGAWGPAALAGLWLVGTGHGELLMALSLPVGVIAAALYLGLPRGPVGRRPGVVSVEPAGP